MGQSSSPQGTGGARSRAGRKFVRPASGFGGVLAAGLLLAGCATTVTGAASPAPDLLTSPVVSTSAAGSTPPTAPVDPTAPEETDLQQTGSGSVVTDESSEPDRSTTSATSDAMPVVDPDEWYPTEDNEDPSLDITGIFLEEPANYGSSYLHVTDPERVAYQHFPPMGGSHDGYWAACNGVVYQVPVRNENMVHSLEHGAVWITYNPETLSADDIEAVSALAEGQNYLMVSPYPGLKSPLSLQSWGHQLELDSPWDERLYQFVYALRQNPYLTPEINATCDQPTFDVTDPPPFDPSTPGPDAFPLGSDDTDVPTGDAPPTS